MKHVLAAAFMALSTPAVAQSPVVVELFTSQGCSSCPPADTLLHELAARDDVIALALHVDYWDYIGWKDAFAHPDHGKRQRAYALHNRRRSVYTPQMIVQGQNDIVGTAAMKLADAISEQAKKPQLVALSISRQGANVAISATRKGATGALKVHMLRYTPRTETRITRGENAGRTLAYSNVASDWQVVEDWDAGAALSITAPAPGKAPVVVIVQQGDVGPILAAARLR